MVTSRYELFKLKINHLTFRERLLISLVIIGVCIYVLNISLFSQFESTISENIQEQQDLESSKLALEQELQIKMIEQSNHPVYLLESEVQSLEDEKKQIQSKFENINQNAMSNEKLQALLFGLQTHGQSALEIVKLNIIPLLDRMDIYQRYQIDLDLTGEFDSVLSFLQEMEKISDKTLWYSIKYQVIEHPVADIKIKLYAISDNEGFVIEPSVSEVNETSQPSLNQEVNDAF